MMITGLAILAALVAVQSGVDVLPVLFLRIWPNGMRYFFEAPSATAVRIASSPALQSWLARLRALGFVLLGVKFEAVPLLGPGRGELSLACAESETYAGILFTPDGGPRALYLYTPLQGGGLVFTRNFVTAPEMEAEGTSVRNVAGEDFAAILASHQQRLRAFKEKGLAPIGDFTQEARIVATRAFYESNYARNLRYWAGSTAMRTFLTSVLALISMVVWSSLGAR